MKRIVVIAVVVTVAFGLALLIASLVKSDATTTTVALSTSTTTTVTSGTTFTTAGTTTTTKVIESTTTTSLPTTTTATTTTTSTPAPPPPGNHPPTVTISSPAHLSKHWASYDSGTGRFGAAITFSAAASDSDGDPIAVRWYSSIEGFLGSGTTVTATIHTQGSDSTQPFITARVTDQWGVATEAQIQIIVSIPSDT